MKIQEVTVKDANGENITAGYFKSSYETHLQIRNNQLTIGKTHILHGFVKASAAATISCLTASAPVTTSWNEVSLLITPTSKMIDIVFSPGEYWIYNWKLEVGTIPSLWSPSSLDAKEDLKSVWSQYQQLSNKFDWIVKGDSESHMELTDKIYRLIAENINLSGKVTFSSFSTGLQEQITGIDSNANQAVENANSALDKINGVTTIDKGKTVIDGGKIATGTILSDSIAANSIKADRLDVTDLSALGATIGGWTITDTGISNDFWNEYDRISYTISLNTPDAADSKVIDLTKNNDSQFYIMQSGKMYAKNADISGKITASSGKIGGYTISDYELVGSSVGISSLTGHDWAFWAGNDNSSKAPFRVGHDGHLYATNADISGTITSADINNGNGTFKVDKNGKVTASNINISGGSIALNGNLSNSTIDLKAVDNSGNNYELWMNGAVLRIVKNDENLITLYGTTGSIGAQTMYAQEIQSDKFREPNRGYAMCGDGTGHTYHCHWNGSALGFQVDTTWVWSSSDKRLKKNINAINQDYIDAVGSVDLFQYNLNRQGYSDKPLYFGAMVQDIIEKLKNKGHADENLNMIFKNKATSDDDTLYYGMNYEQFLILRLAGDEQRIAALERQISKLKEQI